MKQFIFEKVSKRVSLGKTVVFFGNKLGESNYPFFKFYCVFLFLHILVFVQNFNKIKTTLYFYEEGF